MNEKIKELWSQVDTIQYDRVYGNIYRPYIPLQIAGEPTRFEITDIHLEKFAELIIRECSGVCEGLQDALDRHKLPTPSDCAKIIKEHFGVSE